MTLEKNNLENSSNLDPGQTNSSKIILTEKSPQELSLVQNLDTILNSLINGNTLTHCIQSKISNPLAISSREFYQILEKNPELEKKILEARKLGIQTLIDRLLEIFNHQELENPNQILWIREKTKFIQWVASKLTTLYSDNKVQSIKTDQSIKISWLSANDDSIIDVTAAETIPTVETI